MQKIIGSSALARRRYWIDNIQSLTGSFGGNADQLEQELKTEIIMQGYAALLDHLHLCGAIPEAYQHDSSEEKLYSKYTDVLLAESFRALGINSFVLKERADAADVEAYASNYSFVADAKSFRLSRTAKNQKDFKVQAMDGWKRGKPYAMVVCPIYQLPAKSSQIYAQASTRHVCIFTYSHLAVLVAFAQVASQSLAETLLLEIFKTVNALHPSKDAHTYWSVINRVMLDFSPRVAELWHQEKLAASESIFLTKEESLTFLAQERERIMRMSHADALLELIRINKIDSRMTTISTVTDNALLSI